MLLSNLSSRIIINNWDDIKTNLSKSPDEVLQWVHGFLPIHYATRFNDISHELIHSLIQFSHQSLTFKCQILGRLPIHWATRSSFCYDMIKILIHSYNESVLIWDECGYTPLTYYLWSCSTPSMRMVRLFIECHVSCVRMCDKFGYCALHHATKCDSRRICQYLIECFPESLLKKTTFGFFPRDFLKNNSLIYNKLWNEERSILGDVCTRDKRRK